MKNPFTAIVETRIGVMVVLGWATLFVIIIFRAQSDYVHLVTNLYLTTPPVKGAQRVELDRVRTWLAAEGLNPYGDPEGTVYGDEVLVEEDSSASRYRYLVEKFPERPWRSGASKKIGFQDL